ncbi:AfsR/SARP family transcriptional regulator [Micromonospora aurantiaca (nom. illeg.)]|uniref:AfsR/SARP family transcriptional regulator n=1 Tax=Micromonospora aurantiaca (nom. illeg.) TaxID=47850 RepID=UPI00378E0789
MRWPRQLMSLLVVLVLLAGPPLVLLSLVGPPMGGRPSGEQMREWVRQPLTEQTLTAALTVAAWLLWLVLAYTVTVRVLTRVRVTARWLRRLPLPTPLQATAGGMAGAAVLGVTANSVAAVPPQAPQPATAGALDDPTTRDAGVSVDDGITVPAGWLPRDVAEHVVAAAALVWLRRRRAYQSHPPRQSAREDPDLTSLPPTVAAVQAALADAPAPVAAPASAPGIPALRDVFPASGVGITGPGALAVGRGLLVTVLLAGQRHAAVSLVTTRAALTRLLGPHAETLGRCLPRLTVVDTIDEATRIVESAGRSVQARDDSGPRPDGPVADGGPTVVLLIDDGDRRDVAALADAVAPGGGVVVLLGRWPAGPTWQADTAGRLHDPRRPDWSGPRWCVLDRIAATDLLTVIAHPEPAQPDVAPVTSVDQATSGWRVPRQPSRRGLRARSAAAGRWLELRVLGEPALLIDGRAVTVRRTAALQVLVFLAAHPDGAGTRQLIDAMWPGVPRQSLTGRLYTTLSELRGVIRTASGLNVIDHADDRYRLNPTHIDVDLWRLHDAVQHAATAVTNTTIAWQAVIDAYPDDLAAGRAWPWLDPVREATRRHVIDAYVALADAADDPHRAIALLQAAIRIDPYNAELTTRAVNTLVALGKHDAAHELRDGYARRLTQAGLRPDADAASTATDMRDAPVSRR